MTITLIIIWHDNINNNFNVSLDKILCLFEEVIVIQRQSYIIPVLQNVKHCYKICEYSNNKEAQEIGIVYAKTINTSSHDLILDSDTFIDVEDIDKLQAEFATISDIVLFKYNECYIPTIFNRTNNSKYSIITSAKICKVLDNFEQLAIINDKILHLQKEKDNINFNIANMYYQQKKYKKAMQIYKHIQYKNQSIYNNLSNCYEHLIVELQQIIPFFTNDYFTDNNYRKLKIALPHITISPDIDYIKVVQKCCKYSKQKQYYSVYCNV